MVERSLSTGYIKYTAKVGREDECVYLYTDECVYLYTDECVYLYTTL